MTGVHGIERFLGVLDAFNDRDWVSYRMALSDALMFRAPGIQGIATGREPNVEAAKTAAAAFPDGRIDVERSFSSGEWGCVQVRFSGTHTGPLRTEGWTISPTDRPVQIRGSLVMRFGPSGEAVEIDEYFDRFGLMAQLGIDVVGATREERGLRER